MAAPLRDFSGHKQRVVVLSRTFLQDDSNERKIEDALEAMRNDGFEVYVAIEERLSKGVEKDFGILADIATHTFEGLGQRARGLAISFNRERLDEVEAFWRELMDAFSWTSSGGDKSFSQWRKWEKSRAESET